MNWLLQVPIHIAWLPHLSWAVLIWTGLFLLAAGFAWGRVERYWRSYRLLLFRELEDPDETAERLHLVGQLANAFGAWLVAVICIVIGVVAALGIFGTTYVLLFLLMALVSLLKSALAERYHAAAMEAARQQEMT